MTARCRLLALCVVAAVLATDPTASAHGASADRLQVSLHKLVHAGGGPPGAIVLVQRGRRHEVFRAGVANVATGAPMRQGMYMRIASTAKAYSGGVALSLVERGVLSLDDSIGDLLPWAPRRWHRVSLGEALHHTSGLPDFSSDPDFLNYLRAHLADPLPPRQLLGFVTDRKLEFEPGSRYRYSNSDNIVVGLMVRAATGRSYRDALARRIFDPLKLHRTRLPRGVQMSRPTMHGYDREDDGTLVDVTELVAAGWAWASGGIVSTPADQNRFVRAYVGGDLFGREEQKAQFAFIRGGHSEPPGPGRNSAGLAIFRYRTGCGTMFGHTGNTLGYTQFMAASHDGRRSVVVSIDQQVSPKQAPHLFELLRDVFHRAMCTASQG